MLMKITTETKIQHSMLTVTEDSTFFLVPLYERTHSNTVTLLKTLAVI